MNALSSALLILVLLPGFAFSQDFKSKAPSHGYIEKTFENPGGDAPILKLPKNITQLADAIIKTKTLNGGIKAVANVLAKGGVAVKKDGKTLNTPVKPLATAFVEAINLADMVLEAQKRQSVASLTARQLAQMLTDFGFEAQKGKTETESFMFFLRKWTQAALAHPNDPTSFAILFIAANNQLQSPRADLTWTSQSPDLIRFSRLELELLSAAFERMLVDPAGFTAQLKSTSAKTGPCGALSEQLGDWNDTAKVAASELIDSALKSAIEELYGQFSSGIGEKVSNSLSALSLATKIWKFTQFFRYGTFYINVDTENPTHKPRPSQADKFGKVSAHAGVDQQTYDDYLKWISKSGAKATSDINDCLDFMGLPTKTDITDVAKDAKNWRVSWDIIKGEDQVQWKRGQYFDISSRQESYLKKVSDTEASTTAEYKIMPQEADIKTGKERNRTAVFSAKLRRGKMPEVVSTLWGQGKAGFTAGKEGFNNFSSVMGLVNGLVDIAGNWVLEVASPKRYATQKLIEIVPKGWVGTILVSANKKTAESRMTDTVGSWDSQSHDVEEQTIYQMGGSKPVTALGDMEEGVGTATTSCKIQNLSSIGLRVVSEGCEVIGCNLFDEMKTRLTLVSGSGPVDMEDKSLVRLQTFPASEYIWYYLNASTPEEKAYWLAKLDTWELSLVVPQCESHNAGMQSEWSTLYNYNTISGQWEFAPGYPKYSLQQNIDMPAPIYIDSLPNPVLTGKLNKAVDPRVISVDKTIPIEGYDAPIHVQINLHLVD